MESGEGPSFSPHASEHIRRRADPAEPRPPAAPAEPRPPAAPAPRATVATDEHPSRERRPAGSGSVPLLLLSPPDADAAFSHRRPRAADADGEEGTQWSREEAGRSTFILPRSSPVVSGRHRPVSWHGVDTGTSASPRCATSLSLDSSAPASASPSPDQCAPSPPPPSPTARRRAERRRGPPAPAQLNRASAAAQLLGQWARRPFGGQQGPAGGDQGRGPTACDASDSSVPSTSTDLCKERSCGAIPEVSADIFKTSCDLEKENAHFAVVDMMLEVLEGVKWTLTSDLRTSGTDPAQHSHGGAPPQGRLQRRTRACGAEDHEDEHPPKTFSILSSDSGIEECRVDNPPAPTESLRNAESLAQKLVLEFRRSWLPSREPRRGRQSLRSSLQELPDAGGVEVSSLAEEIQLRTRMRGSQSWAPPRFQIIFTVQPTNRRSDVVALQHFLCAGCGTKVEPKYIKKLRYCEYLGRYFCDCCHGGSEAVIPGRLLSCWDFGRYPVSYFSKQLLDSIWHQPVFDLTRVGKTLYSKVKELDRFRELQEHLMGIKKLLSTCRLSGRVMAELEQLPVHLVEQPHLFSMEDLSRVKKGQLVARTRALLLTAIDHVQRCELCLARGFICEFCRERDVIFPFQADTCRRCPVCKACFHKHCFVLQKCPKCARIQSRKRGSRGNHEVTPQHKPL
ncbi:protein associated with UVRAG as autophagy enhancer isoform X2 [Pungitius pungitius]|uniref:protein associated with UVRAG as autophagy enhancer isoform X2 n=1 Tax=Pungitius pungitius TaxID=134920 RepID=UPI002E12D7B5